MSLNVKTLTYDHGNNKLTASFYQDYILMRYVDFDTNIVYESTINESIVREYKQLNNFNDITNLVNGAMENDDDIIKIDIPVPTKKCLTVNITYDSKYIPFTICLVLNRLQGENTFSGELKKSIMELEKQNAHLLRMTNYLRKITEHIRIPIATFTNTGADKHTNIFSINPNADILWLPENSNGIRTITPDMFNINDHHIIQDIIPTKKYRPGNDSYFRYENTIGPISVKVLYLQMYICPGTHTTCVFWYETLFNVIQADTLILDCSSCTTCQMGKGAMIKLDKFKRVAFVSDYPNFKTYFDVESLKNAKKIYLYNTPTIECDLDVYKNKFVRPANGERLRDILIKEILDSKFE